MEFKPIAEPGHVFLCDRNDLKYELQIEKEHSISVCSDGKWEYERVFELNEGNYLGVVETGGRTECRSLLGPLDKPPPRDGRALPRPLDDGLLLLYFGLCMVLSELLSL